MENKLEHPCFPQPQDGSVKVWRYVDTSKLLDLLSRKSLFLSRLDLLGDAHEGSITKLNHAGREAGYKDIDAPTVLSTLADMSKRTSKVMFVNCWYFDNHESEAMWKLYCADNKGVALQTTYQKLVDSISHDNYLYVGRVSYIDYETEWFPGGNIFYQVMHKRKAFRHEREIRLVRTDSKYWAASETPPPGIHVPWDMEKFIENVYVNPYSKSWYYDVVQDVLAKYGCKTNIKWSTMKGEPLY